MDDGREDKKSRFSMSTILELERIEDDVEVVEVVEVVLASEDLRDRKLGRCSFGMREWRRPTASLVTGSRGKPMNEPGIVAMVVLLVVVFER